MYIHQNPNNIDLSTLVNEFHKKSIIDRQKGLVNTQKGFVQNMLSKMKKGEETLEQTLKAIQDAGEKTAKQLEIVGFAGVLNKKGEKKPGQNVQERLDKEAKALEKYGATITEFLELYGKGKTIFSGDEIKRMQGIQSNVQNAITKLQSGDSIEDYKATLGQITGVAADAIGSLSEYYQAQLLHQAGIQVKLTGAEASKNYRSKTSDYQITFTGVDPEQFKVGVSVKRTKSTNTKSVLAKVKTAALESLLNASQFDFNREPLYNIMANHGRTYYDLKDPKDPKFSTETWKYNGFDELITNLHRVFLLTSLAGDLDKSDFALYMVINDKVYSILDLVYQFFEEDEKGASKKSGVSITSTIKQSQADIAKQHTALVKASIDESNYSDLGEPRSASMINKIASMSVIIHARIQLSLARTFDK